MLPVTRHLLAASALFGVALGYSSGAPDTACTFMAPLGHAGNDADQDFGPELFDLHAEPLSDLEVQGKSLNFKPRYFF